MTEEEINKKAEKHCNEVLCNAHKKCYEVIKCYDWRSRRAGFFCGYEQALKDFEKEPKEQGDKWFVFETDAGNWGMDKATQYTVDRHNYFYGTKEECQKWGVEHKIKDYTGHKYCYDRLEDQLTKAKEIIKAYKNICNNAPFLDEKEVELKEQAEQFLSEVEK